MAETIFRADNMEAALLNNLINIVVEDYDDPNVITRTNLSKKETGEFIRFLQQRHSKMIDDE